MSETVIASIISAVAVVLAAALPAYWQYRKHRDPHTINAGLRKKSPGAKASLLERLLATKEIRRLLSNKNWQVVAQAAIDYHVDGVIPIDDSWMNTATWRQVSNIVERVKAKRAN